MTTIEEEIANERLMQDMEWGGPDHDDKHDWYDWRQFLYKQLTSLSMEYEEVRRRRRFIKIAALAIAAVESMDRKAIDVG
jgi:hypothetical protein